MMIYAAFCGRAKGRGATYNLLLRCQQKFSLDWVVMNHGTLMFHISYKILICPAAAVTVVVI